MGARNCFDDYGVRSARARVTQVALAGEKQCPVTERERDREPREQSRRETCGSFSQTETEHRDESRTREKVTTHRVITLFKGSMIVVNFFSVLAMQFLADRVSSKK